jgi:uncharacterized protein (DUF1800 family)
MSRVRVQATTGVADTSGKEAHNVADTNDIIHLLRRTEFVARATRVAQLTPLSLESAVDDVLDFSQNTTTPPAGLLVHDPANNWTQRTQLHDWWVGTMVGAARPFQEKMTLFWHGHFVTDFPSTERADLLTKQLHLYRQMAIGNFRAFTHAMAIDPQMLRYLSGSSNTKGNPNENFARELMELFTLGVGNYTQDDIAAAAQAWTGHNLDWATQTYRFYSDRHDNTNKTFFDQTKNWDGPDIINEILRDNAEKKAVAARYISRKLWEFLAYQSPANSLIDELATIFLAADLELRPLVRAILLRPEFYSAHARQALVRSPVEWCVAIIAHTGLTPSQTNMIGHSLAMGQRLTEAPDVSGWESNAYYLNTGALSSRAVFARHVTGLLRANSGFNYLYPMTTTAAVDAVAAFFGVVLAPQTRQILIDAYNAERTAVGGSLFSAVSNLLIMTMLTGEMNVP